MSDLTVQAREHYDGIIRSQFQNQLTHQHTWLEEMKRDAREAFDRLDFPDRKQEAWRYTGIDKLLDQVFVPAHPRPHTDADTEQHIGPIAGLDTHRLIFIDNRFRVDLSALDSLAEGVHVHSMRPTDQPLPEAVLSSLRSSTMHSRNSFTALNSALVSDGIIIHLDTDLILEKPLELVFLVTARNDTVCSTPRVFISLAEGAAATLIERYHGNGRHAYFHNVVEEVVLGSSARLGHYRLVDESAAAFHLSSINVKQGEGSQYKRLDMQLNGAWIRSDIEVEFNGRGATSELHGFYTVDDGQQNDVHVNVMHRVPECTSSQQYKGLLLGRGRAVFDGRIVVERDAQYTDASMSNHNLMLAEDAEVDTRPQLVIHADNVKCSHGTTVGQIDPEQLFYLRSRGITEHDAIRMLCQGYAADILASCEIEALRDHVTARLESLPGMNR